MKPHRGNSTWIIAALLLCTSSAWSQAFYTQVIGFATACGTTLKYYQTDRTDSAGSKHSVCKTAYAEAQSKADLELGSTGGVGAQNGSGGASSATTDTVILTPPPDFNGTSVPVTLSDIYSAGFTGSGGTVKICWLVPDLVNLCVTMSTNGGAKLNKKFTLPKSKSGFQFEISKIMHAVEGSGKKPSNAVYVTLGDPVVKLPVGWTCSYASGTQCGP